MGARIPFSPPAPSSVVRPSYQPTNYLGSMLLRRAMYGAGARPVGNVGDGDPATRESPTGEVLLGEPPVASSFKDRLLAGLGDVAQQPQDYAWYGQQRPPQAASFLSGALSAYGAVRGGQQARAVAQQGLERQSLQDQLQASLTESTIERNQDIGAHEQATTAGLQARAAQNASDANVYRGLYPELGGFSDDEAIRQGRAIKQAKLAEQKARSTSMTPQQQVTDQTTTATGDAEGLVTRYPGQVVQEAGPQGGLPTGPPIANSAQFIHDYLAKKYPHLDDGRLWGIASKVIKEHQKGMIVLPDAPTSGAPTPATPVVDTTGTGPDAGDN